jgi:hypothetical protein
MKAISAKLFVLLLLLTVAHVLRGQNADPLRSDGSAVACLYPINPDILRFLKASRAHILIYRLRNGGIPDTSDDRIALPQLTAVFYSADQKRAVVFGAVIFKGNVLAKDDGWLLRYQKDHWEIVDGAGGLGTFQSVVHLVDSMKGAPTKRMEAPLSPSTVCKAAKDWDRSGSSLIPYQK